MVRRNHGASKRKGERPSLLRRSVTRLSKRRLALLNPETAVSLVVVNTVFRSSGQSTEDSAPCGERYQVWLTVLGRLRGGPIRPRRYPARAARPTQRATSLRRSGEQQHLEQGPE